MLDRIGAGLSRFLERDQATPVTYVAQDFDALCRVIRVGDVLLVEGRSRISVAIRYLTQSTWDLHPRQHDAESGHRGVCRHRSEIALGRAPLA